MQVFDPSDGIPQALPIFAPAEEPMAGVRAAPAPLEAGTDDFFRGGPGGCPEAYVFGRTT